MDFSTQTQAKGLKIKLISCDFCLVSCVTLQKLPTNKIARVTRRQDVSKLLLNGYYYTNYGTNYYTQIMAQIITQIMAVTRTDTQKRKKKREQLSQNDIFHQ